MWKGRTFDRTYEGLKLVLFRPRREPLPAFDRTYEGLKHTPGVLRPRPSPCKTFDRTYEGLKPPSEPRRQPRRQVAFDRTYEGLKHGGLVLLAGHLLLTVPMRV